MCPNSNKHSYKTGVPCSAPLKDQNDNYVFLLSMLQHTHDCSTSNWNLNLFDEVLLSKSCARLLQTLDGIVHSRYLRQLLGMLLTILMAWFGRFSDCSGKGLRCTRIERTINTILSQCSMVSVLSGSGRFIVMLNIIFRISADKRISSREAV